MAIVDLIMPKLGESIMEATVLKWHKKPGDAVKQDETVLDIATDKVDSEVPSTAEGIIKEILFNENDVVAIGTVIARIESNEAGTDTLAHESNGALQNKEQPKEEQEDTDEETDVPFVPQNTAVNVPTDGNNRFYSPLVLNIANSERIPLSELEHMPGTGNEGRVTKKDILQYIADRKAGKIRMTPRQHPVSPQDKEPSQQTLSSHDDQENLAPTSTEQPFNQPDQALPQTDADVAPHTAPESAAPSKSNAANTVVRDKAPLPAQSPTISSSGNVEIIEMDRMRKLIAKHMVSSKQTSPHVTSFAEADVTNMVKWRDKIKNIFEQRESTKITFTPLFIECITKVIKRFPYVNCSVDGERIILKKDINIGMATALPNGNLIVPVIKNADYLNLVGLSKAVNSLAANARNNTLKSDDISGGTFTLTNVGTFGSLMGTPIINQPQVAILAVGIIKKRPVVLETPEGDAIGIRHMMYLSLSYDHRVVDGSVGAGFLSAVAKEFEDWDINRQW